MSALLAIFVMVVLALILVLAPGMLVNLLLDRFAETPEGFIKASIGDELTWGISLFFWLCVASWGYDRVQKLKAAQQQHQQQQRR